MKKIILLFVFFIAAQSFAQTNGISYQAIIMNPKGEQMPGVNNANSPVVNKNICLVFKFVDEFSNIEYQETVQTKTDGFGMVNLVIGKGTQTAGYAASFQSIVWNSSKKSLIVGINTNGNCSTYTEISNQEFSYAPLAFSAINAENVTGVVAIENGGTNAVTVLGAKTNLQLENVDNTTDLNKPISTATQTALNLKENTANKSIDILIDGNSDIKYPSVKSVKMYVDGKLLTSSNALTDEIARATAAENTIASNLVTETSARTSADATLTTNLSTEVVNRTAADSLKEDVVNKSTDVTTDGTSDTKYPSVKSVKTYVDANAASSSTALANEVTRATAAENTIAANLTTEATARTSADVDLTTNLSNEVTRATASENTIAANLTTEATARTSADVDLTTNLSNEVTRATTAENTIAANLTTETSARTSADATLTTNLSTEVVNRTAADLLKEDVANKSTNVTIDGTSDTKYPSVKSVKTYVDANAASSSTALANEVTRATAAENTIAANLTTEATARTSADVDLTTNLSNEVTRATTAENTIAANLTAETAARTTADATLQTNINAVQTDVDANETAANAALNLKAPLASPTFTGTVSGITKTMVGLGNIDDTSDLNKPVSTATQTALNLKVDKVSGERLINATEITKLSNQSGTNTGDQDISGIAVNATKIGDLTSLTTTAKSNLVAAVNEIESEKAPLASPTLTGIPLAPTATAGTNTTQIATTEFVTTAINSVTIPDASTTVKGKIQLAGDLTGTASLPTIADGVVTSIKILDGTIVNTDISSSAAISYSKLNLNSSIVGSDIADGAITSSKIANLSISNSNLAVNSITTSKVANGTVTTSKMADQAISTIKILDGAVTSVKIADSPSFTGTPLAPTATAGTNTTQIATTEFVTTAINSVTIPDASTTEKGKIQLAGDLSGTAALPTITNDAVTSTKIADGTILNSDISSSAGITYSKLTLTNSIQNSDLVANSVTTSKVADGTVTTSKMADQAISSLKILDGAVTSVKIADSPSFTGTPLAPTAVAGTNTTQIATTAFVAAAITGNYVDLTTNQTIAGTKTFSSDLTINATKFGRGAGSDLSSRNIAIGNSSLSSNSTGSWNTAIGTYALQKNTGSSSNTAIGNESISESAPGSNNTGVGSRALMYTSGAGNTSIGTNALINSAAGNNNTAIGLNAFSTNTTGSNNTAIGASTVVSSVGLTNATAIGYGATVANDNTIQLGNTSVTDVKTSGTLTAGTVTYPKTHGTSGQVLSTNGSGTLSWSTPSVATSANFVDLTTDQTIAGTKSFDSNLIVKGITVGASLGMMGIEPSNTLLGYNVTATNASESTVVGYKATANGSQSIALGSNASANQTQGISIGFHSAIGSGYGFAIGSYAQSNAMYSTALGAFTTTGGNYAVALGYQASASAENSIAIGKDASVTTSNTIQLGNTSITSVKTSGAITANSYVKSGGTSSQFLKADGSVDSSTYLTSATGLPLTGGALTGGLTGTTLTTSGNVTSAGTVSGTNGSFGRLILNTATQSSSSVSNYDVSGIGILFIVPNSNWENIAGLSGGVTGQVLQIINANNDAISCCTGVVFQNDNAGGTQKIKCSSDMPLGSNQGVTLVFDGTYWRVLKLGGMF